MKEKQVKEEAQKIDKAENESVDTLKGWVAACTKNRKRTKKEEEGAELQKRNK